MKNILNRLINHEVLSKLEAKEVLVNISIGSYNTSQIVSFLTVYMMRNITIEELAGFREALLELCIPIDLSNYNTVDLCGTGGDGKDTFNISTLASFVAAGAGIKVAKHGNYGVSSISGSSNVMEKMRVYVVCIVLCCPLTGQKKDPINQKMYNRDMSHRASMHRPRNLDLHLRLPL